MEEISYSSDDPLETVQATPDYALPDEEPAGAAPVKPAARKKKRKKRKKKVGLLKSARGTQTAPLRSQTSTVSLPSPAR